MSEIEAAGKAKVGDEHRDNLSAFSETRRRAEEKRVNFEAAEKMLAIAVAGRAAKGQHSRENPTFLTIDDGVGTRRGNNGSDARNGDKNDWDQ